MMKKKNQINIIITGVGGQGIVKAGHLIGKAVASGGDNVVMSEIHGMSQRGGIVGVDIRIGDGVYGPIIPDGAADLLIGFEAVETLRVLERIDSKKTTVLMSKEKIVPVSVTLQDSTYPDASAVAEKLKKENASAKIYEIDALRLASEAGNPKSTNVVLVGAAYSAGFIPVPLSDLEDAVKSVFPERSWESNLKSLQSGMEEFERLRAA